MSSKFTCRLCKEQFDQPKGLYKHLQSAHNAGSSRDNRTCPICGVLCSKYEGYRDHLLYIHGQNNEGKQLTFKTLNDFLLWKTELEIKYHCKYVLQSAPKVLPTKEKKYFYQCDGSNSKPKDKKTVAMKSCSSVISVVEGAGVFKVEYWDTHSGHNKSTEISIQNELDAAISSVEMVNAIADSDDSLDKPECKINTNSSSFSPVEKKSFVKSRISPSVNNMKTSPIANTTPKTKSLQSLKTEFAKKKTSNASSMLFSLASVACGKGISKKSSNKLSAVKNESQSKTDLKISVKNNKEKESDNSVRTSPKKKFDSTALKKDVSISKTTSTKSISTSTSTISKSSSVPATSKGTTSSIASKSIPSGPLAIAPKPASLNSNSISSLFTGNNVYPNQLVFVNQVGVDQNSSPGQNIVFSLPLGQSLLSAPQSVNQTPLVEEISAVENTKLSKSEASEVNTSGVTTKTTKIKDLLDISKSLSNGTTSIKTTTTTSSAPITLTSGINNTPVLLSSLPVGSTFMSVNNNLIPIATPSGTFLPSSLPPNIVLAPVSSTTTSNTQSGLKTPVSSVGSSTSGIVLPTSLPPNIVLTSVMSTAASSQSSPKITFSPCVGSSPGAFFPTSLPPNIVLTPVFSTAPSSSQTTTTRVGTFAPQTLQTQLRFSSPSTPITVSSIVKEPVYSSSSMKLTSNVITSSTTAPISSTKTPSTSTPKKAKCTASPIAIASPISGLKPSQNFTAITKGKISADMTPLFSNIGTDVTVRKVNNVTSAAHSSITSTSPPVAKKARKSTSKNVKITASSNPTVLSSSTRTRTVSTAPTTVSTNVVDSQLNLAPISSTPGVTMMPQQINSGTLIFESSGEIFMLEPIESNAVTNATSLKNNFQVPKIKIDRSVQTVEDFTASAFKSKPDRKRAASSNEDDAVMMKVKCYQLEMQYLKSQAECKQLKIELTKERLKNAELTGQTGATNNGEETSGDSRTKAREIMKEIEDKFRENKEGDVYTMAKTSVLRSLYEDIEELCMENGELCKELDNYRAHDKFFKSLKKRLYDEDF